MILRHFSTTTATEYPTLAVRQDALFVMNMEHEEGHGDNQSLRGQGHVT